MPLRMYSATGRPVRSESILSFASCAAVMYTVVEILRRPIPSPSALVKPRTEASSSRFHARGIAICCQNHWGVSRAREAGGGPRRRGSSSLACLPMDPGVGYFPVALAMKRAPGGCR